MKEFNAQTGGRYVYVDDVLNLQGLALAFGQIFDECDNFILSGCKVSSNAISEGYVYLNGKLRHFPGASGITSWPQYLYEKNATESVNYASGDAKVGRTVYGVAIGSAVPSSADPVTKKVPVSMVMSQNGGTLLKDAFFGKYSVILNPKNLTQVVRSSLNIEGDFNTSGEVVSSKKHKILSSLGFFETHFADGALTIRSQYNASKNQYAITMKDGVGIGFSVNNSLVATIGANSVVFNATIQSKLAVVDELATTHVYNRTEATNTASLDLNMRGFNGEANYYRNTRIGDGRGTVLIAVDGQAKTIDVNGVTTINSGASVEGLVFANNKPKNNSSLRKTIVWKDSDKAVIGTLGFTEDTDMTFRITNGLAGVHIYGAANSYVDLGPSIKENGQLLAEKYVLSTSFKESLKQVAKLEDVYTKQSSDEQFAKVSGGLSGFLSATTQKSDLRKQIGAIGAEDLNGYLKKENYLSGFETAEEKKRVRDNIGAAGVGDFQSKLKDTGWIEVSSGLFARQIGNVVSIQGTIQILPSGVLFTIPNTIDPPTHAVYNTIVSYGHNSFSVAIKGGDRQCKVTNWNGGTLFKTEFSITYMV